MIVMTETAQRLLVECGACAEEKIRVVPARCTGAAHRARGHATAAASSRATATRFLLSTFGLISPGKGLETVIEALPAIVERHPEVVYVIAGRTHPDVAHREGERYRLMLERRVLELGLGEHVEFDDRFLSIDELSDLLAATDVFVTPVPQSRADRLRRADLRDRRRLRGRLDAVLVRAGHARLRRRPARAVRRSQLRSPTRSATTSNSPESLAAARAEARRIGVVARLAGGRRGDGRGAARGARARAACAGPSGVADLQLTSLRTDHLLTLVDDVGIVQHAHGIIPNRDTGYCVDDVARLAVVSLALARRGDEQAWTSILYRALAFLHAAKARAECATS